MCRPATKSDITDTPNSRHIPGYAGHIPGLDAGTEMTFGTATTRSLQAHAATVKSFAGNATSKSMNEIPRERGSAFDRSPRARTAPALMEPLVPGYKGYVPGRQHVYARTFGMTTSELGSAHQQNKQDKNAFINYADPRCAPALFSALLFLVALGPLGIGLHVAQLMFPHRWTVVRPTGPVTKT